MVRYESLGVTYSSNSRLVIAETLGQPPVEQKIASPVLSSLFEQYAAALYSA
jgi:hypothetical protein